MKAIEDVKIQSRVLEELDGHLKRIKGRTLPLVVPSNVSAEALLKAAQDKHSRHFKQFDQHLDYVLLLSTPCLEVLFFPPLTNIKKNLKNLFANYTFGYVVPQTSKAVLISWKKSLNRAVSQGHHTFQTLPPQLQK